MAKTISERKKEAKKLLKNVLQEIKAIYRDLEYDNRNINVFTDIIKKDLKDYAVCNFITINDVKDIMCYMHSVNITETKAKRILHHIENMTDFEDKNIELIDSLNMRDMNFVERKDCQYPEEFDNLDNDDVDDDEPVEMRKVR